MIIWSPLFFGTGNWTQGFHSCIPGPFFFFFSKAGSKLPNCPSWTWACDPTSSAFRELGLGAEPPLSLVFLYIVEFYFRKESNRSFLLLDTEQQSTQRMWVCSGMKWKTNVSVLGWEQSCLPVQTGNLWHRTSCAVSFHVSSLLPPCLQYR